MYAVSMDPRPNQIFEFQMFEKVIFKRKYYGL